MVLLILVAAGINLSAKPVSLEETNNVAKNWMFLKAGKQFSIQKALASAKAGSDSGDSMKVRIIKLEPNAWVIVSADDVAQPVLGYGESPMDLSSQPPAFKDWINNANLQIEDAIQSSRLTSAASPSKANAMAQKIADQWKMLRVGTQTFSDKKIQNNLRTALRTGSAVTPLLWMGGSGETSGIIWNQSPYYNDKCPSDSRDISGRTVAGCVAVSMGQIMRYHQSPAHGTGSHSYDAPGYGTQSADFGSTTYNWSSMPYQLTDSSSASERDAVSTLLYQIGVSVDMGYGWGWDGTNSGPGSGAYDKAVPVAFKTYFGYEHAEIYGRDNYESAAWNAWLQEVLAEKWPLYYSGSAPDGKSGHAFVLDGYDGSGYYHFNWGWGGGSNGQFALNDLTPQSHDFTSAQIGGIIVPSSSPPPSDVTREQVTELFVAFFNRAPRNEGLDYWVNDSDLEIEQISESFFDQDETKRRYPSTLTNSEFINQIFQNLFNRDAVREGLTYWVNELQTDSITRAQMILAIVNGAQGQDATILNNKRRVGEHFADLRLNDLECAEYVMLDIDATEQSVQDAFAYMDNGGCS